jgi:hypothetical protein
MQFSQPLLISSLLGPNITLSNLFSIFVIFLVWDQVLHQYKDTDKAQF